MKRWLVFLAVICCISIDANSASPKSATTQPNKRVAGQPDKSPQFLFRIKKDGKYGFINQAGKVIIEPRFDNVAEFSDGLARICISARRLSGRLVKGKWIPGGLEPQKCGYIDRTGKIVIQPKYVSAGDFSDGLARVSAAKYENGKRVSGGWGFINKTGRMVIRPRFGHVLDFSEGLAVASTDTRKYGYINKHGRFVIKPRFSYHFEVGRTRVYEIGSFSDGLAQIGACTFINKRGKIALKVKVTMRFVNDPRPVTDKSAIMKRFSEGLAPVKHSILIRGKGFFNEAWGYANKKGQIVIKPRFRAAKCFSEGLAAVCLGKWGYINKKGKIVIKPQFDAVGDFSEGLAYVSTRDGLCGYIDKTGKIVFQLPAGFRSFPRGGSLAHMRFRNGLAGGDGGYIDKRGKVVFDSRYSSMKQKKKSEHVDDGQEKFRPAKAQPKPSPTIRPKPSVPPVKRKPLPGELFPDVPPHGE